MRVLIADDHPLTTDALAAFVYAIKPTAEVLQANSFEDAVQQAAAAETLDLVMLDYRMPGIRGLEGLRIMLDRFPGVRIAMVSGYAEGPQMLAAIELGAVGFIPKDLALPAFTKALELIIMGETYVPARALRGRGLGEDTTGYRGSVSAPGNRSPRALTAREREVLAWVSSGKPNKRIAELIGTKEMTVAFHLKNIFKKLGVSNRTEAAAEAAKMGLVRESVS